MVAHVRRHWQRYPGQHTGVSMLTRLFPDNPACAGPRCSTLTNGLAAMTGCGSPGYGSHRRQRRTMIDSTPARWWGAGSTGDPAAPEPASGFRLGKTAVTARNVHGGDRQPAGLQGRLRRASRRRLGGGRGGGRADGAGAGGAAVFGARWRRLHAALRRRQRSGRWPTTAADGACRGHRELPALVSDTIRTLPQPGRVRVRQRPLDRHARVPCACSNWRTRRTAGSRGSELFDPAITWPTTASTSAAAWQRPSRRSTTGTEARPRGHGLLPQHRRHAQGRWARCSRTRPMPPR